MAGFKVSTQPFNIVMMPTPEEGLTKWHYSHGNVTYIEDKTTETKNPVTGESKNISTKEEKLGVITVSFDPRTYRAVVGCFLRVAPLPSPTYSVQQIYIPINVILTITQ